MVGYTLNDSLPFAMLGFVLMLGYSAAFMVLFDNGLANDDGDNFHTLPRALETLFHAGLGNFDNDVSSVNSQLFCYHPMKFSWCRCFALPVAFSQSGGSCCSIPLSTSDRSCS